MAIPSWRLPSNKLLATLEERVVLDPNAAPSTAIDLGVYDPGDLSKDAVTTNDTEINQFHNVKTYSNLDHFFVKSDGLPATTWTNKFGRFNKYTPIAQSYVFMIPRNILYDDDLYLVFPNVDARGDIGVAIDGAPLRSSYSNRLATIGSATYTENNVIFPTQSGFADGTGTIGSDQSFYYQSNPFNLNDTHPDGHSKIIGYAFDGFPIYGPYGYEDPLDPNSNIKTIESSYRLKTTLRSNNTKPDGSYIEDFEYEQGSGDLDIYNGRFGPTPDYPATDKNPYGTYAYFATVDPEDNSLPRYPYLVGPKYRFHPITSNGNFQFPGTVDISVISGSLPPGLFIDGTNIVGTPYEVSVNTEYTFVLRATNSDGVSDRTYRLVVNGPDVPVWSTNQGDLDIGSTGSKTIELTKKLRGVADPNPPHAVRGPRTNDTILHLSSVSGIRYGSVVTAPAYTGIQPGTTVTEINQTNRTVRLSKRLTNNLDLQKIVKVTKVIGNGSVVTLTFPSQTIPPYYQGDLIIVSDINITGYNGVFKVQSCTTTTVSYVNTTTTQATNAGTIRSFKDDVIKFVYKDVHTNLYILDNAKIDYQLAAVDNDIAAGQVLNYYIPPRGGQLPPGISLTLDGRLTGFTDPLLSTEVTQYGGFYDVDVYDTQPFDYGERATDGFDSFLYDTVKYDYSDTVRSPKKLNRYYEFVVRVSDGVYYEDRKFRIYVVADDFFRADDTIIKTSNVMYTADATYIRNPVWLTPSYLGRKRANNYVTVFLDVFDPATLQGQIGYILEETNPDTSASILPPGMELDQITGEIYGSVPYQPAITQTYNFSIRAIRYDPTSTDFAIKRKTTVDALLRAETIKVDSINNIKIGSLVNTVSSIKYFNSGTTVVDYNIANKTVTLSQGLAIAMPAGTEIIFTYVTSTVKQFSIDIIGEVDSTIKFITDGDLGYLDANFISNVSVEATTTVPNSTLVYSLIGGRLPPGLTLLNDGTIQGKINQYSTTSNNGLTTIDGNNTSFDMATTSLDRIFIFTVNATDQFNLSSTNKTFKIEIRTPNNLLYSNVYVKPFMSKEKRIAVSSFLSDSNIFERDKLYRPSDVNFGIQNELKMLLYPGIETKTAAEYVSAFGRSSWKRFRIGDLKKATAKKPGTNTVLYELVYLEIIDNLENDVVGTKQTYTYSVAENIRVKSSLYKTSVNQGRRDITDGSTDSNRIALMNQDTLPRIMIQDRTLTADSNGQLVSDTDKFIFGNSVSNIRKKLAKLGDTERNYLPLWMRTPQTRSGIDQGFTKAIPICYCLPGQADYIMLNIKNSGFDFRQIDFTIDRAIIDSVTGEVGDKYIAFGAREITNG